MKYHNRWSEGWIQELEDDYKNIKDLNVIAEKYNLKVNSLKAIISMFKLKRGRYFCGQWTYEQIEILKQEYPSTNHFYLLCEKLGKSTNAVRSKAFALGIKRLKKAYRLQ